MAFSREANSPEENASENRAERVMAWQTQPGNPAVGSKPRRHDVTVLSRHGAMVVEPRGSE
jgi:hypothetical protein